MRPTLQIGLLASLLVACGACEPTSSTTPARDHAPILLVGIDGMEWDVVLPMLKQGRLPHLASLMEVGAYGELESASPTKSPILWTSMATGVGKDKHGIRGFLIKTDSRAGADGAPQLYTSRDRRTKAFWDILSDYDRRVYVVGWWLTYPAEAINGVMVAQTNTFSDDMLEGKGMWKGTLQSGRPGQVTPAERQDEMLALLPEVESELPGILRGTFGIDPDALDVIPRTLWERCHWAFRADEIYRRVSLKLLREDPELDLLAVYFGGTDVVGHRFWRYLRPEQYERPPSGADIELLGNVIPAYYEHIDTILGELIEAAPDGANVIVATDHGMVARNREGQFTEDLDASRLRSGGHPKGPPGVFVAAGPDVATMSREGALSDVERDDLESVGSLVDVTPTLLALLGVPVGRDMDGRVLADLLLASTLERTPIAWVETHTPVDWAETRAFDADLPIDDPERLEQLRSLGYID